MFEIFREMNWILLGSLIVVSALVSWAGDVIGMRLGKKRITFLNLRPKYTSRIISVVTGVGIAVATLLILSVASEQVRTALFSMQFVQRQLGQMEIDLFESRGDLAEKQEELTRIETQLAEGAKSLEEARSQLEEMSKTRAKMEKEQAALQKENDRLMKESKELAESVASLKKESDDLKSGMQRLREGRIAALSGEVLSQGVLTGPEIDPRWTNTYTGCAARRARCWRTDSASGRRPSACLT